MGLLDPRRILLAVATAGVVFAAAASVAVASADQPGLPATLSVPAPAHGDEAVYDGWGDEPFVHTVGRGEARTLLDRHGVPRWTEDGGDGWYDASTGVLVLVTGHQRQQGAQHEDPLSPLPLTLTRTWEVRDHTALFPDHDTASCLRTNSLRGPAPVDLDGPVRILPPCHLGATVFSDGVVAEATGVDRFRGVEAVRFTADEGTWWFSPELPYPVAVDAAGVSLRLRSHTPGDGEAPAPPAPADPAPPLDLAPRAVWGMDESGVGHPYPASRAYRERGGPVDLFVERWLAENPDHYVADGTFRPNNTDEPAWLLRLVGRDETLRILVQDAGTGPLAPGLVRMMHRQPIADDPAPAPGTLPDRAPTVRSLADRAAAVLATEGVPFQATSWSTRYVCGPDCSTFEAQAVVEHLDHERRGDPAGVDAEADGVRSQVVMRFDGTLVSWTVSDYAVHEQAVLGDPLMAPDEAEPPAPAPAAASTVLPTAPEAVFAGLLALLAGAVVWLWPVLKGTLLGLFSRFEDAGQLLRSEPRRRLRDAVAAEPGIHRSELRRRVGLSNGRATHHLGLLVRAGLLVEHRAGGYTCYFVADAAGRHALAAAPALRSDTARSLLRCLARRADQRLVEVSDAVGTSPSTTSHHIRRMVSAGLVRAQRDGRCLRLRLTPEGEAAAAGLS